MSEGELVNVLRGRIQELENKVDALRISRRVLMNLIDALEREKKEQVQKLQNINDKLQKNNCRYAKAIMCRNMRINELESRINLIHRES
ncbi:MAG: translation initiation factor 2 [Bacillota bacterium]|nr:translation initiation factor 2 [Negativicutes bacterium]